MIDAVLSYHMNPQTCGVAKFNQQLAQHLGVPVKALADWDTTRAPMVSVKTAELGPCWYLEMPIGTFDLFLHDVPEDGRAYLHNPRRVIAANSTVADAIRANRPDVIDAFCPSTVEGNATRGAYRVLVFGMAHKLNLPHFETLKAHLDDAHPDYTIELSTAVHEGSPWSEALTDSIGAMRSIFGSRLRVLGFLGDDGLALALQDVDAVACYFTPALRANNTSYWAAVDAGKTIYTNRDAFSPKEGERKTWDDLIGLLRA